MYLHLRALSGSGVRAHRQNRGATASASRRSVRKRTSATTCVQGQVRGLLPAAIRVLGLRATSADTTVTCQLYRCARRSNLRARRLAIPGHLSANDRRQSVQSTFRRRHTRGRYLSAWSIQTCMFRKSSLRHKHAAMMRSARGRGALVMARRGHYLAIV